MTNVADSFLFAAMSCAMVVFLIVIIMLASELRVAKAKLRQAQKGSEK